MSKIVVIGGASGFVGKHLKSYFTQDGWQIKTISRKGGDAQWDNAESLIKVLEGADLLVNLAGAPINTRFTEENKKLLLSSRIDTTIALGKAIENCKQAPPLWCNASGAHIYGTGDEKSYTEEDPITEDFFPALLAKKWEEALFAQHLANTRKVAMRISIVLGKGGGVLEPYLKLTQFYLGGKQGDGQQIFSWIHVKDFYNIILFLLEEQTLDGPVNFCAPQNLNNEELMSKIRKHMGKSFGLPAPAFGIKLAAPIVGVEPDLILKSLSVAPGKLKTANYPFLFPSIDQALADIIK